MPWVSPGGMGTAGIDWCIRWENYKRFCFDYMYNFSAFEQYTHFRCIFSGNNFSAISG